jgi:ribonuclease VapC
VLAPDHRRVAVLKRHLEQRPAASVSRAGEGGGSTHRQLPIDWLEASEPLLIRAAQIKASHALSLADAWIAAAALHCGATLLHKDPEFQAIEGLAQEWLA